MTQLKITKRWLSKLILGLIISIFLIGFLIWIISPAVSRHVLSKTLEPQGIEVQKNSSMRLNPFTGYLSITNLNLIKDNETVLSMAEADVEISLVKLLFKTVKIEKFYFNTIFIKIEVINDLVIFAGFDPSKLEPQKENNSEEIPAQEEGKIDFKLVAPLLSLNNTEFDINHDGTMHSIVIEELKLTNTKGNLESLTSEFQLKAQVNGAKIEINNQLSLNENLTKLKLQLKLKELSLDHYANYLKPANIQALGSIDLNIESDISITDSSIIVDTQTWNFQSDSLAINHELAKLKIDNTNINGKPMKLTMANNTLSQFQGGLDLELNAFRLFSPDEKSILSAWDRLKINDVAININQNNDDQEVDASIANILFNQLTLSQGYTKPDNSTDNAQAIPPLAKIDTLTLNTLAFKNNHLAVNEILFSDLESALLIDKSKSLKTLVALPQNTEQTGNTDESGNEASQSDTEESETDSTEETPFTFNIDKIALQNENKIRIEDESVSPNYKHTFYIDQLLLKSLTNTNQERSPISIKGRSNEYAKFEFDGAIAVFSDKPDLSLSGNIHEIDLHEISPYIRDSLGFELKNGQLDSDLKVSVNQGELDGKVEIYIRGLDTSSANDVDNNLLKDQGAIPLNIALGMLKDKKGNIELDIPLKGSTDDPSFNFNSVVMLVTKKVVMSQAKSYLMKTFVPYANVISVAMAAGEFALKLRFEDLSYAPGQIEVGEEQTTYAQEFINLMRDKDDTQVKICGLATPEELNLPQGEKIEDDTKIAELRDIAKRRAEAFKRYAVEIGKIDSSRLLLCTPKIDFDKEASPHISITI